MTQTHILLDVLIVPNDESSNLADMIQFIDHRLVLINQQARHKFTFYYMYTHVHTHGERDTENTHEPYH